MFTVYEGGNMTVENIILDGGAVWAGTKDAHLGRGTTNVGVGQDKDVVGFILYVKGGEATLGNGAVVQNNDRYGTGSAQSPGEYYNDRGGAVSLQTGSSKLTMKDGSVIRDSATNKENGDGGAVTVWDGCTFVMEGGEITGCYGTRWGAIRLNGSMTMSGGTIHHNMAVSAGGGVIYLGKANLTFSGDATITDNYRTDGTLDNLFQSAEAAEDKAITLGGNFTGSVGIHQNGSIEKANAAGGQFGLNSKGYTGASNFFSDVNDAL